MPRDPAAKAAPPDTRPRKERKDNADMRRRQLLEATLDSVAKNGLARTTLATVAAEAGLSQGVAVFYFKSKSGLLAAALRAKYEQYQQTWQDALAEADDDPMAQIVAVVTADFAGHLCDKNAIATWFAFWGEQRFTPQYAEIAAEFDATRHATLADICARLIGPDRAAASPDLARRMAMWIDTFTDGLWQKLHLDSGAMTPGLAVGLALDFLDHMIAPQADRQGAMTC